MIFFFFEILAVPMCVTKGVSPLGRFKCVFKVAVMDVKQDTECIMWSVVPVSITQSVALKLSLLTVLAEKIKCFKVGLKGKLGMIPYMVLMKLACDCEEVEAIPAAVVTPETLETILETPSPVLTLAA